MQSSRRLILASASPRRQQLLALGGWTFETIPVAVVEIPCPGEKAEDFVRRMSGNKARRAAELVPPGAVVLAADTVVALDGHILGKPADPAAAIEMLTALRGRAHRVLTGLTIVDTAPGSRVIGEVVSSIVPMRDFSEAELRAYVAGGDPLDKAGAYAIQNTSFRPVDLTLFVDCFANVMGLPLCHLRRHLRCLGLDTACADLAAVCRHHFEYACPLAKEMRPAQTC